MDLLHTHCSLLVAGCEDQEIIHNQINKLHFNIKARQGKALPRNCQNSQALSWSCQFVVTGSLAVWPLRTLCRYFANLVKWCHSNSSVFSHIFHSVNTAVNVALFESHHISDSICICLFQTVPCNSNTVLRYFYFIVSFVILKINFTSSQLSFYSQQNQVYYIHFSTLTELRVESLFYCI